MLQVSNAWMTAILTDLLATRFTLSPGVVVHLAVAPFTPLPTSDPATFVEATFAGYATAHSNIWNAPHLDSSGDAVTASVNNANFTGTGVISPPVSIAGYWIVDAAGTYLGGEVFPTPFLMGGAATPLTFTLGSAIHQGTFSTSVLP